ncbi:MAG: hypothetical protein Q7U16_02210 [Agitococcus sp.]|nr:hypothetical protein [Agitococcus sp.]
MGGNALKNCVTRRYPAQEYYPLEASVLMRLKEAFPNKRIVPIKAYRNKETFGDMDILLESPIPEVDLRDALTALFEPKELVSEGYLHGLRTPNGQLRHRDSIGLVDAIPEFNETGCISFEHHEFQVDVLCTPTRYFDFCSHYYDYNDLGNLCGVLAKSLGVTLGFDGLWLKVKEGTRYFGKVLLTSDYDEALVFLGYDVARYHQGFDAIDDMFDFVQANPHFNGELYTLANRNNRSRTRDVKRTTYIAFLARLSTTVQQGSPGQIAQEELLSRIYDAFPHARAQYEALLATKGQKSHARQLFSGATFKALTGLEGKALGLLMADLRKPFLTNDAFLQFIAEVSMPRLRELTMESKARLGLKP